MLEKYALIRVMDGIFAEPQKEVYVREFAKARGLSVGAAGVSLNHLLGKRMVSCRQIGRSKLYRANLESPLTRQWKTVFSLEKLQASGIVEFIRSKCDPISLLLYGSLAKGTDDLKSDVDLLLITLRKQKVGLERYCSSLHREINLLSYTPAEWRERSRLDNVFYGSVILDSIALFGERPVV